MHKTKGNHIATVPNYAITRYTHTHETSIGLDLRECLDIWMEDDLLHLVSPDLPCLSKSSKTLGPTPSDLLNSRESLDIWMEDDLPYCYYYKRVLILANFSEFVINAK